MLIFVIIALNYLIVVLTVMLLVNGNNALALLVNELVMFREVRLLDITLDHISSGLKRIEYSQ
jgi:hypothetical protein